MKTVSIVVAICAILGLALGSKVVSSSHRTAAELRRNNQSLQSDLQNARARADALTAEKKETTQQLAAIVTRHGELTSRIRELEAAEMQDLALATSSAALKPYQAEAYLGRKSLGLVWIVPRNHRMDTNSQRYVYEPVVCLDEKLRKFFEVHHTNIVERVVETPVYVNDVYVQDGYSYPVGYWPRQTNNWPSAPGASPMPTPPPAFNPGSGKVINQPLGTPAGQIKTYPSAPRPPANQQPRQPQTTPAPATSLRTASL